MDYLSLCLICKDENDYLPEWLDYHILMGVDRFYIYDNESQHSLRKTLSDYISRGWVILLDVSGRGVQLEVYDHCIQTFGTQTFWMGFIDTDEFLVPKSADNLKDFLHDYEDFGGLAISSLFFGSNNQQDPPLSGQIAGYTYRTHQTFYENTLIKSIVRPDQVLMPNSPHDFIFKENAWCVNEQKLRVDYQHFPTYIDKIQLNHYFCRSKSEIEKKLRRGRGDDGSPWVRNRFETVNSVSLYKDISILQTLQAQFTTADLDTIELDNLFQSTVLLNKISDLARTRTPTSLNLSSPDQIVFRKEIVDWKNNKNLLKIAETKGDYIEVKRLLMNNIEAIPYRVIGYVDLSVCLLQSNDYDTAWQVISHAWQLARNSYNVLIGVTYFFLRVKNYPMAEKTCHILINLAPQDLTVMGFMTECLIGQERYEEALNIGLPVVELASMVGELPEGMSIYLIQKMANYLVQKEDFTSAIHLWEIGIKTKKENIEPILELVKVLLHKGDELTARQWLIEAQKLDPWNQDVINFLNQVNKNPGNLN
jgi:tetratricopeptide (TPR) repeat protein